MHTKTTTTTKTYSMQIIIKNKPRTTLNGSKRTVQQLQANGKKRKNEANIKKRLNTY